MCGCKRTRSSSRCIGIGAKYCLRHEIDPAIPIYYEMARHGPTFRPLVCASFCILDVRRCFRPHHLVVDCNLCSRTGIHLAGPANRVRTSQLGGCLVGAAHRPDPCVFRRAGNRTRPISAASRSRKQGRRRSQAAQRIFHRLPEPCLRADVRRPARRDVRLHLGAR
jgi:hypothetical protein